MKPHFCLGLVAFAMMGLLSLGHSQDKDKADKADKDGKKPATIEVVLPDVSYKPIELKIEGQPTKLTGEKRSFTTPALDPTKSYEYKIEAVIEPNNYTKIMRTRVVGFKAGDKITVDMTKEDPAFKDDVRIRWVPTPEEVVEEMCKLGQVTKDEIVYDLGCGDGIMIITAVKSFGAKKGVGIDIDPEKVKEAKQKAKDSGVADKIEIREGNILDVKDISDANVVLLYLGNEMNIRLRPMLQKSLKPGARIVSHRFTMGDWKPEKSITVKDKEGEEYELHLWTIPESKKEEKKDDKK